MQKLVDERDGIYEIIHPTSLIPPALPRISLYLFQHFFFDAVVHAINDEAKQFYPQRGFQQSSINPYILMLKLPTEQIKQVGCC